MKVILASASPRRRQLLAEHGVVFEVIPSEKEECADKNLPPREYCEKLAEFKAQDVFSSHGGVVLGADTIVVLDGAVLGKPKTKEEARRTLMSLSGREHQVITGYCLIYGSNLTDRIIKSAVTTVRFNALSQNLIDEYVNTGKPMDKAGSYGIQDGFPLVDSVDGSISNVIGLPIEEIIPILKEIENEQS